MNYVPILGQNRVISWCRDSPTANSSIFSAFPATFSLVKRPSDPSHLIFKCFASGFSWEFQIYFENFWQFWKNLIAFDIRILQNVWKILLIFLEKMKWVWIFGICSPTAWRAWERASVHSKILESPVFWFTSPVNMSTPVWSTFYFQFSTFKSSEIFPYLTDFEMMWENIRLFSGESWGNAGIYQLTESW